MRLLYLGDASSPHVAAWARHFARAGHEVHVGHLAPARPAASIDGVTVHPELTREYRIPGGWRRAAQAVRGLSGRVRPDVTHSHSVVPSGWLAHASRAAPHVATAWGSEVLLAPRRHWRLIRTVARAADLLTADSHHLLRVLEERGADPARLRFVPWGVDPDWVAPAAQTTPAAAAARLGLPAGRSWVLAPRGVAPYYRPEDILLAMASVVRERPGVGCAMVCDTVRHGGELPALDRLSRELGLAGAIRFLPALPHGEMAFAFRAAAVCVSVPSSDSAPVSVFEALALDVPAVVSDLPWRSEPIYREARLTTVPVGAPELLAEAILRALAEDRRADADANRRLVGTKLNRRLLFREFGAQYERLAACR